MFSQKKAFLIFSQKSPRNFWSWLPKACSEKMSYIFSRKCPIFWKRKPQKKILIFQETERFLYFSRRNFLIFWKRYIQNPDIFRTRSIFRILTYLEPCHIQNPRHIPNTVKHLRWNVFAKKQLPTTLKKISYIFRKWKFLEIFSYISGNETFLYFRKRKSRKSCSYILGNGTPKKLLTFKEMELSYNSGSKKNPLLIRRNNNKIDSIENWC